MRGSLVITGAPNRFAAGEMAVDWADQRGDDTRPVWVNFVGKKVNANGVFVKVAIEGNTRTFPVVAPRTQDGKCRRVFGEEIPIQVSDDRRSDLEVKPQKYQNVFKRWFRQDPPQGFWMHRKFGRKISQFHATKAAEPKSFRGAHAQHPRKGEQIPA